MKAAKVIFHDLSKFVTFVTRTSCNYVAGQHRTSSSTWSASKNEKEKKTAQTVVLMDKKTKKEKLHWLHPSFPISKEIWESKHLSTSIISLLFRKWTMLPPASALTRSRLRSRRTSKSDQRINAAPETKESNTMWVMCTVVVSVPAGFIFQNEGVKIRCFPIT